MQTRPSSELITSICDLLSEEHAMLLKGDFESIPSIMERKEDLLQELQNESVNVTDVDLKRIDSKTQQNAILYEANLAAQKSVIDRISEITKAQKTVGTYRVDGTFADNAPTSKMLEKRS